MVLFMDKDKDAMHIDHIVQIGTIYIYFFMLIDKSCRI
jgi:hypothetical protein